MEAEIEELASVQAEAVREIAAGVLGVDGAELTLEASPETVDGWDSLNHLKLITAIEARFGLTLPMTAVMKISDIASLIRVVQEHSQPRQ